LPRRNRVDPWGDLHAVSPRGLFTGNRGCVVDDAEHVVRHHGSSLWIICLTEFRGWRVALARPHRWTPLFFLDDAVGLAAGHRPCATCRRADYHSYRDALTRSAGRAEPVRAWEMNARLGAERHRRGRGLDRAADRLIWRAPYDELPDGTIVVDGEGAARLVLENRLLRFAFDGWTDPIAKPAVAMAQVLTPPTSVAALAHGYMARLHESSAQR
jgi:hypothetical protein